MKKQITVLGLGYVGLATSLTLAYLGHEVVGFDLDQAKVSALSSGKIPLYEEGFDNLLQTTLRNGNLTFTTSPEIALSKSEFAFICVGTPSFPNGEADLGQVRSAAYMVGQYINKSIIVIDKSTVPVGTAEKVERWIKEAQTNVLEVEVVSNPEFLREGSAVYDSLNPSRIVIGAENRAVGARVAELFTKLDSPILIYDRKTAEMIKYASNAFLATKISFINEIAAICDRVGADVHYVAEGMGYDLRIGDKFLGAGIGYGGSCFPKDTSALIQIAGNVYYDFKLLKAVVDVNSQARLRVVQILEEVLEGLSDKTIAVLGLSFKPHTDDVRESPALTIIPALIERGARVKATDPVALEHAKNWFASVRSIPRDSVSHELGEGTASIKMGRVGDVSLSLLPDALSTIEGADAILLLTEWPEFVALNWSDVSKRMQGNLIVDGRNALNFTDIKDAGLRYRCIGRPNITVDSNFKSTKATIPDDTVFSKAGPVHSG